VKIPKVNTKDLLDVTDLSRDEILKLFAFTMKLKKRLKSGRNDRLLEGKSLAMIFEKSSTRTRVSFETGLTQLGGHALFLTGTDSQLGRGETPQDTAKVLSRYVNGIMVRTFEHEKAVLLARNSALPVINGLTDEFHPCQALTDYYTIYERGDDLSTVKMTYVGDGNNVANSLILCAAILGMHFAIATPKKFGLQQAIIDKANRLARESGATITVTEDIDQAIKNTNYLYTDVWTSMGQEKEYIKRKKAFAKYKITRAMVAKCAPGCKVMHCLPAHRGEEIDADVIDSDLSIIFDQAENRLHTQKAVMCALMSK